MGIVGLTPRRKRRFIHSATQNYHLSPSERLARADLTPDCTIRHAPAQIVDGQRSRSLLQLTRGALHSLGKNASGSPLQRGAKSTERKIHPFQVSYHLTMCVVIEKESYGLLPVGFGTG